MMKSVCAIALTVLLAGALGGCSAPSGAYENFDELQSAIESSGVDCTAKGTTTGAITGEGLAMTCNDSYIMYMFTSAEAKQEAIDFYAEAQKGIINVPILEGDDWYVIGTLPEEVKALQKKVGGVATTMTGE